MSKIEDASRYFVKQTQKVYIERCNSNGIETFEGISLITDIEITAIIIAYLLLWD